LALEPQPDRPSELREAVDYGLVRLERVERPSRQWGERTIEGVNEWLASGDELRTDGIKGAANSDGGSSVAEK
jgi:hypothetical protein